MGSICYFEEDLPGHPTSDPKGEGHLTIVLTHANKIYLKVCGPGCNEAEDFYSPVLTKKQALEMSEALDKAAHYI